MSEVKRAVLYTDGGCKPSRGIGGWGVHGYVYDDGVPKVGTGQKDWLITPTGYIDIKEPLSNEEWLDKWDDLRELAKDPKLKNVNVQNYVDMLGSLIPESTNNIAELTAMTQALSYLMEKGINKALVLTDSKYVKEGLTNWVVGWERNGWIKQDGQPVANGEHWKTLVAIKKTLEDNGCALTVEWVKGHAGEQDGVEQDNLGNALADQYASMAIIAGRKGRNVHHVKDTDAKGYWKPKVDINRMFAHSRWYFDTNITTPFKTESGHYVYHLGDHGKDDDFLGKRMSDASFSVLYLKEPEPTLEKVRQLQREEDVDNFNSIVIGRLDFIFKPHVYDMVQEHGGDFLRRRSHKLDLYEPKDLQLTKELRPPKLAFNLIDVMEVMELLLQKVIGGKDMDGIGITDITSLIYEVGEKAKKPTCKIRPELTSAVKSLSATVNHTLDGTPTEIPLTVGMDMPHRNALSALASRFPTVKVVTWRESTKAFRYATIVECEGDVGIFAGFYSNIHLLMK